MVSIVEIVMTGRLAILEIKDKAPALYKKFEIEENCFPEQDTGIMGINTQFSLYKYLLFSKDNKRDIVPIHRKVFNFFVISVVILIFLMIYL